MADRVELAFRRAARDLIPRDSRVLVAVSGGADSVALLRLLQRASRNLRLDPVVAHLDHGLRRGSRADRRFVERLASEADLACVSDRREVELLRRRGESPEEAARRVRRAFLIETAGHTGCDRIATGHTLDDQAETVLMRLVRGAGATALTGMSPAGPGPFVRPLLGIERADLRAMLDRYQVRFREDPSNRDLRFDRNRVRRLVLPVLAGTLNPRAARHLVKAADRFREDAVYLDSIAEAAFERIARRDRSGRWVLAAAELSELPPPLAKRVARLALRRAGSDDRRISAAHVDALLTVARGPGGGSTHLPSRVLARKHGRSVRLARESPE